MDFPRKARLALRNVQADALYPNAGPIDGPNDYQDCQGTKAE
jgi:hypothetical protein